MANEVYKDGYNVMLKNKTSKPIEEFEKLREELHKKYPHKSEDTDFVINSFTNLAHYLCDEQ